jgi:hypothetical protein
MMRVRSTRVTSGCQGRSAIEHCRRRLGAFAGSDSRRLRVLWIPFQKSRLDQTFGPHPPF